MRDASGDSKRVKLQDGRFLAYKERGVPREEAKHKIIIVHGFGCTKYTRFSASKELIEELGVYFLYYDRSGYGESDTNPKHSLKSEVDDIEELAGQLEIGPKFHLIGISMGSYPTWGCLKHIPDRLSGVALVAPLVNYRWPFLPKKLVKKVHRRDIKWGFEISKYAPGLIYWWVTQKIFPSFNSVEGNPAFFKGPDKELLKRTTGFTMFTKDKLREKDVFDTLRGDFMACFGKWDFEPADLAITRESPVHIWQGKEDKLVSFQLQRCILEKQPLINYHEIPQRGHLFMCYDSICDAILRTLLLGEEDKMYKTNS